MEASAAVGLRDAPVLEGLPDAELDRLAAAGREIRLAAGEFLFRQGDPATLFHVVLEGRLETTREVGGEQVLMLAHGPGGFLGAMALLTETSYRGTTFAVVDTVLFEVDGEELRRLAFAHPPLLRRFLPAFESVSHAVKGIERDREKLLAVGQLAAGLAHELNNPVAAAARVPATLREAEEARTVAFAELAGLGTPAEGLAALVALGAQASAVAELEHLDPLAESDREDALADALRARGVAGAAGLAAALTEARLGPEWVDRVAATVGEEGLGPGLRHLAATAGARVVTDELETAATRIADLVGAVRDYTYLDQGERQAVDVHEGLEATLAVIDQRLRDSGVAVVRELAPDLPAVEASGSELNQVWTNLLANAIDALGGTGRITVRTRRQGPRVCVEIADDGPGIPDAVRDRIFDPFFTTKPVGEGTGLGLDIAQRIVVRNHGEIRVEARPGETCFQVLLPAGN